MEIKETVFAIPCPDFMLTGRCNLRCKYCFEKDKDCGDMDKELLYKWLNHNPLNSGFPFGGEPLLVLDTLIEIIKIIEKHPNINKERKQKTIKKCRNIITNGILVPHLIDKIKKHKFRLQFSVDGCKEAHNINRIYPTGKGSFDDVMKGITAAIENGVEWSCHGVISKKTLPYIFESFKWFFNIYTNNNKDGINYTIEHLKHNTFQIIFEDEYEDKDIDILIDQFGKIAEWIWNHEKLTKAQKFKLFNNWFFKTGGMCGAGTGLLALDEKLNIYPCHRVVFRDRKKDVCIGNVFHPEDFDSDRFQMYNAFHSLGRKKRYMYSAVTHINAFREKRMNTWFMWCPATNIQETKNPYFQPVKYNVMFTELNRFIRSLRLAYFGERQSDNSDKLQQC